MRRKELLKWLGIAALAVGFGTACGGEFCRQCNPVCSLPAWPRLVVGFAADGDAPMELRFELLDKTGSAIQSDLADAGVGPNLCRCLNHLSELNCTRAYLGGGRDVVVRILDGERGIGACPVRLAEHNYCGVDVTSIGVRLDTNGQVSCGQTKLFNVCD